MKKVAIVTNDAWSAYNMRLNLAKAIQNAGYEVIFIAPESKYTLKIQEYFKCYNVQLNAKGKNPLEELVTVYNFYKVYKEIKPDIILHYTIKPNVYGSIAAGFLNIPVINNIAGLGTLFIEQNLVTKIAKYLYKFSQRKVDKVFFQNSDDFNMFIDEHLVEKSKCDILPGSGVDVEKFKPVEKKDDGTFRFLVVARMLWAKGISEYVKAAHIIKKKYKNIEFQLLGHLDVESPTAITQAQMDEWVKEGDVIYLGVSDHVQEVIANVDCMVLPSYYREGTPRTLLESASMEKPIITTDNVGCRDVVDDGINGYLCEVKNVDDLVKKMEMVLELSETERRRMGKAGREKIIQEFDEKIVITKYLQSIEKIVK